MFTAAFKIQVRSVDASLPSRSSSINSDPSALVPIVGTFTTVMESNTTTWDTAGIGQTLVYLEPSTFTVALNCNFTISVSLSNVSDFWGFGFSLFYDNTVLRGLQVAVSQSLLNPPISVLENQILNTYNATHGEIRLAVTSADPAVPANGSGTLALITFNATAKGNSTLHLSETYLHDRSAAPISHTDVDGYVECRDLCPEPYIFSPCAGESLSGNFTVISSGVTEIMVTEMNFATDISSSAFDYSSDGVTWISIGVNSTEDCGMWSIDWNLTGLQEGIYTVRVTMTDKAAQQGFCNESFYYDPTLPTPQITQPLEGQEIKGLVPFEINTTASDIESMTLEYLNGSKDEVDQVGIGSVKQTDVGPTVGGCNMFCAPTAVANALLRMVLTVPDLGSRLVRVKDSHQKSEYMLMFVDHELAMLNQDKHFSLAGGSYYDKQKDGSWFLTPLGLAVVLAKKMGCDPKTGCTSAQVRKGLKLFLKEQGFKEDEFAFEPKVLHTIQPDKPVNGSCREQWYTSGGDFTYLKQSYDGTSRKWVNKEYRGPCTDNNTRTNNLDDLLQNLKKGEGVVISVCEAGAGTDGKIGTADDTPVLNTSHSLTGEGFLGKDNIATFVDPASDNPNWPIKCEWKLVKGTVDGCYKEFIEVCINGKWNIVEDMMVFSPTNKDYQKALQCASFLPIGSDPSAPWLVQWDTTTIHDGYFLVKATLSDTTGNVGTQYTMVYVNNNPPAAVTLALPNCITPSSLDLTWTMNRDDDFLWYLVYQSGVQGMLGTCVANITDASLTSYTVTGLSPQTAYYFTIQVVDIGRKSTNSNQVARLPLSIAISPDSVLIYVGQSQLFSSSVSGGTSPYAYQWYLNDVAVLGATSATWTFTPTFVGSYTVYVKVADAAGTQVTSNTATAKVHCINEIVTTRGGGGPGRNALLR
jgi:hypothetical protein